MNWDVVVTDDHSYVPPDVTNTNSFVDAAMTPRVYTSCLEALKSLDLSQVQATCGIPLFVIGSIALAAVAAKKLLFGK